MVLYHLRDLTQLFRQDVKVQSIVSGFFKMGFWYFPKVLHTFYVSLRPHCFWNVSGGWSVCPETWWRHSWRIPTLLSSIGMAECGNVQSMGHQNQEYLVSAVRSHKGSITCHMLGLIGCKDFRIQSNISLSRVGFCDTSNRSGPKLGGARWIEMDIDMCKFRCYKLPW